MADAYISELRLFPWDFTVRNWASCQGQLLLITQNTALFSLIGVTYGGDGQSTFRLPDLRGRVPIHRGQGPGLSSYPQGSIAGTETVTLLLSQLPAHTHLWKASSADGNVNPPAGAYLAKPQRPGIGNLNAYADPAGTEVVLGNPLATSGGNQPHPNMQPTAILNWCICLSGYFPSRN